MMSSVSTFFSVDEGFGVVANYFKHHEPVKMHLWATCILRAPQWGGIFRLEGTSGDVEAMTMCFSGLPQQGL